jgi:hypothetical protein
MRNPSQVVPALLIATSAVFLALHTANAQEKSPGVMAILISRVDSRTAKVGDAVTAKTIEKTRLQNGAQIPQGAKLVGVITDVTPMKNGNGLSMLDLKFEQIIIKHDRPIAIHGGLLAVAPPSIAKGELPLGSTTVPPGGLASMNQMGYKDDQSDEIPAGSTIVGVGLSRIIGSDGASELQGSRVEVKLNRGTRLRIGLL